MGEPITPTWATREVPIVRAALRRIDRGEELPTLEAIRLEAGLDVAQTRAGLAALEHVSPPYLRTEQWISGPERPGGAVRRISERTRRELGMWPTPETILQAIINSLNQKADNTHNPDEQDRLRAAAEVAAGIAAAFRRDADEDEAVGGAGWAVGADRAAAASQAEALPLSGGRKPLDDRQVLQGTLFVLLRGR